MENYPIYIQKAVNWWIDKIQEINSKIFDNIMLRDFSKILAEGIEQDIEKYEECTIGVDEHYIPSENLREAGEKIGLKIITGYPSDILMIITEEEVKVTKKYGGYETIWKKYE